MRAFMGSTLITSQRLLRLLACFAWFCFIAVVASPSAVAQDVAHSATFDEGSRLGRTAAEAVGTNNYFWAGFGGGFAAGFFAPIKVEIGVPVAGGLIIGSSIVAHTSSQPSVRELAELSGYSRAFRAGYVDGYTRRLKDRRQRKIFAGMLLGPVAGLALLFALMPRT